MNALDLSRIQWPESWRPTTADEQTTLAQELRREVGPNHPLWQKQVYVIGRRVDDDDILVWVEENDPSTAVVHLTWQGEAEPDQAWPHTAFYTNVSDALLIDAADSSRE